MAKKKKAAKKLVIVECDGRKMKAYFKHAFSLSEEGWFAYYRQLKQRGVIIGIQRSQGDKGQPDAASRH